MNNKYWMQTHSGGKFYFDDPAKSDIRIEDIAHALANTGRFGGHTEKFYPVSDHSVWCSFRVPHALRLPTLLHDSPEAYIGDIPSPMKWYLREHTQIFDRMEWDTQEAIAKAFGFDSALFRHPQIKDVDTRALFTERKWLLAEDVDWGWGYDVHIESVPPTVMESSEGAKKRFLWRFYDITGGFA
jgi:hypothetical protein